MADYPSGSNDRASPPEARNGIQNRHAPLTGHNRTTIDNLPPEIRVNIMRQAMRGRQTVKVKQTQSTIKAEQTPEQTPSLQLTPCARPPGIIATR